MSRVLGRKQLQLTIIVIVTHYQFLQLSVLAHFTPYIFVESIEVVLELAGVHLVLWIVCRVLVHVWHEHTVHWYMHECAEREAHAQAAGWCTPCECTEHSAPLTERCQRWLGAATGLNVTAQLESYAYIQITRRITTSIAHK